MRATKRFLLCAAVLILASSAGYRVLYPYGKHYCMAPCMYHALWNYAANNENAFPDSPEGPYAALSKLYPEYLGLGDVETLAGVSGDLNRAKAQLQASGKLDATTTSWVYLPGLRLDDDPRLALIYERRFGIRASGRRDPALGRMVVLLNGEVRFVKEKDWERFQAEQETLRPSRRAAGNSPSNSEISRGVRAPNIQSVKIARDELAPANDDLPFPMLNEAGEIVFGEVPRSTNSDSIRRAFVSLARWNAQPDWDPSSGKPCPIGVHEAIAVANAALKKRLGATEELRPPEITLRSLPYFRPDGMLGEKANYVYTI
jgi:hypothetical protein